MLNVYTLYYLRSTGLMEEVGVVQAVECALHRHVHKSDAEP